MLVWGFKPKPTHVTGGKDGVAALLAIGLLVCADVSYERRSVRESTLFRALSPVAMTILGFMINEIATAWKNGYFDVWDARRVSYAVYSCCVLFVFATFVMRGTRVK